MAAREVHHISSLGLKSSVCLAVCASLATLLPRLQAMENDSGAAQDFATEKFPAPDAPATVTPGAPEFAASLEALEGPIPLPDEMVPTADYPLQIGGESYSDPSLLPDLTAELTPADPIAGWVDATSTPWITANGGYTGFNPGVTGGMVTAPRGFSNAPFGFGQGGVVEDLLDGFGLSASVSGTYDSNPSQGFAGPTTAGEGAFFMTLGGTMAYRSKASEWTCGATYSGSYSEYFTQSDLSGYNQNAGAFLNYQGGPFTAGLNVGVGYGSGANRFYAAVVDELSVTCALTGSYRISSKTSLNGNFSQSLTSATGGASRDTSSFNLGLSAMWVYSPLTQFGPGIRYTSDSGNSNQQRTAIAPTLNVNYRLASKVTMNSSVGLDFSQYEGGGSSDPGLTASIGLNYRASDLWGMSLSFLRGQVADPSGAAGFRETNSLRIGYNRTIRRASLNLGMSYEVSGTLANNGVSTGAADLNSLSFDSSISMPIFANTTSASLFFRFRDQSGGPANASGFTQIGFSLSRGF